MHKIEVQYFNGCPHAQPAMELVKRYVQEHPEIEMILTNVPDNAQAAEISFRGSPTILFDGMDLFDAPIPENPHLACRFYPDGLPDYYTFMELVDIIKEPTLKTNNRS
jgi:hypothetical protein